jgi:hypothetical protein
MLSSKAHSHVEKVFSTLLMPGVVLLNGLICGVKAPYYALHDIVKTLLLPMGIVYYWQ